MEKLARRFVHWPAQLKRLEKIGSPFDTFTRLFTPWDVKMKSWHVLARSLAGMLTRKPRKNASTLARRPR